MSPHLLVLQLRFVRSELVRSMEGISDADARRRLLPMNCLSWIVGHLADQENRYWVSAAQGRTLLPGLNPLVGPGKPASTPPLEEMWKAWRTVTEAADPYLEGLHAEVLQTILQKDGKPLRENVGTMLLRNIYHYWYHIGEAQAIRQMLGHKNLPQFVGDMTKVFYRPEGS